MGNSDKTGRRAAAKDLREFAQTILVRAGLRESDSAFIDPTSVQALARMGLKSIQDRLGVGRCGKYHMGVGVPDVGRMKLPVSASTTMPDALLYGFLSGRIEAISDVLHPRR